MKKLLALVLLLALLTAGCSSEAPQPVTMTTTSPVEELTDRTETDEEAALLGLWSNNAGVTAEFTYDEQTGYSFTVTTVGYELSPNVGPYRVVDGVLYLEGWFSQNETEYHYENDRLTLEINGCSFTLIRQG